jgi:phosphopantothenoylcysteine decarboxylase/phosphopantothenate--cysteine ligase
VSDWRFQAASAKKIHRKPGALRLTMLPNPDIIREVARRRRGARPLVVGFALETHDRLASARRKLAKKGLDLIVANGPESLSGARARAWLVGRDGAAKKLPAGSKDAVARAILAEIGKKM